MVRKRLFVLTVFVLIAGSGIAGAQTGGSTWRKLYGQSQTDCGSILIAEDGGLFVVGTTNLSFEGEPRGDVFLFRTDVEGEVLWGKTYGEAGYQSGLGLIQTEDGSLLISGVATSAAGDLDAYLLKVDQEGNELWSKTFGGPLDEMAGGIAQTGENEYIMGGIISDPNDIVVSDPGVAGYGGLAGRSNLYVIKLDGAGNERWSKAMDSEDNIVPNAAVQTADGGFLVLSTIMYFPEFDDDIMLTRLDGDGNVVWTRVWEDGKISGQDMIATADGNFLLAAAYTSLEPGASEKAGYLFIKVDAEGNELWRSTFGDPDMFGYAKVIAESPEGGFVAVGEHTRDRYTWESELAVTRIDADGQLLWQRITSGTHMVFADILNHPEGGYIIAGAVSTENGFRTVLIKTGAEGTFED